MVALDWEKRLQNQEKKRQKDKSARTKKRVSTKGYPSLGRVLARFARNCWGPNCKSKGIWPIHGHHFCEAPFGPPRTNGPIFMGPLWRVCGAAWQGFLNYEQSSDRPRPAQCHGLPGPSGPEPRKSPGRVPKESSGAGPPESRKSAPRSLNRVRKESES